MPNPQTQTATQDNVSKKPAFDSPIEKWGTLLFVLPIVVMVLLAILIGVATLFIKFIQLCQAWLA